MQSDRRHDLFRTFRFRLAIYHVLLVSGALTATFIISFSVAKSSLLASGRKRMGNAIRQAQIAYFGGKWPEETEQLPEDLLDDGGRHLTRLRAQRLARLEHVLELPALDDLAIGMNSGKKRSSMLDFLKHILDTLLFAIRALRLLD